MQGRLAPLGVRERAGAVRAQTIRQPDAQPGGPDVLGGQCLALRCRLRDAAERGVEEAAAGSGAPGQAGGIDRRIDGGVRGHIEEPDLRRAGADQRTDLDAGGREGARQERLHGLVDPAEMAQRRGGDGAGEAAVGAFEPAIGFRQFHRLVERAALVERQVQEFSRGQPGFGAAHAGWPVRTNPMGLPCGGAPCPGRATR